jgi:curli biogenesis system outer membrane secretion channel CsgG
MCKEFNCLPSEGGLLDQPAKVMSAFYIIQGIIEEYKSNRKKVGMNG